MILGSTAELQKNALLGAHLSAFTTFSLFFKTKMNSSKMQKNPRIISGLQKVAYF
jgi:hypothetical protein